MQDLERIQHSNQVMVETIQQSNHTISSTLNQLLALQMEEHSGSGVTHDSVYTEPLFAAPVHLVPSVASTTEPPKEVSMAISCDGWVAEQVVRGHRMISDMGQYPLAVQATLCCALAGMLALLVRS